MEMTGPCKAWKSKGSFPPLSTAPWKSRQRREISTFPQPQLGTQGKVKTGGDGRSVGYGKVEIQKQDSHFPTAPKACGARNKNITKGVRMLRPHQALFFRIT